MEKERTAINSTAKIGAAIIGLGRIASLLEEDSRREKPCTHAGAISANNDCILLAGCDKKEERRMLFSERWNVPVYADAEEMIKAHHPEILVIATHPDSHYHYCRLAAALCVPVVICEKPLADTLAKSRKISALTAAGNKRMAIITNHERRYSGDYIKAKEILAGKKLGAILSARAVLCMGKNQVGASPRLLDVLWHDGTHMADALMFLTDSRLIHKKQWGAKLTSSSGTAWLLNSLVSLNEQIPVILEISAEKDHLVFEIEFSCEKGMLRIGNGVFEIWESAECPYAEKFRSLKLANENRSFGSPTGYFANMISDAAACAREPGRQPVSSAADGLTVIEYLNSVKAWH